MVFVEGHGFSRANQTNEYAPVNPRTSSTWALSSPAAILMRKGALSGRQNLFYNRSHSLRLKTRVFHPRDNEIAEYLVVGFVNFCGKTLQNVSSPESLPPTVGCEGLFKIRPKSLFPFP